MTLKRTLLSGILFFLINCTLAQPTPGVIGIGRDPIYHLSRYLSQLRKAKEDTSKVDLLLKVGAVYHRNESRGSIDSALFFARSAIALSKSLKYATGYNNATYLALVSYLKKKDYAAARLMLNNVYGELKVCLLKTFGECYLDNRDAKPEELRKAYPYLQMANSLSRKLKSRQWMTEVSIAEGKYHFHLGEMTLGKECFYRVIRYHQQIGDKAGLAHWWDELGRNLPDSDSTYAIEIYSYGQALKLFQELGDYKSAGDCQSNIAYVHSLNSRIDLAEKFYLAAAETYKSAGITKRLPLTYRRLSQVYQNQANMDKALQYALLDLKASKTMGDSTQIDLSYAAVGSLYYNLGDLPASIKYFKLSFSKMYVNDANTYTVLKSLTDAQIKMGNPKEALQFLRSFLKNEHSPNLAQSKQLVAAMFGDCYAALKDLKTAEKYYVEMIRLNNDVEYSRKFATRKSLTIAGAEAYLTIGRFYAERGKFIQADPYLKKALASKNLTAAFETEGRLLISKADSAAGNYLASIGNYQRYVFLKDSIAKTTKDKEFSILKVNFKIAQREKDFKILQKEATLQKQKLELSARTEKFTYAGFAALFCLLGLLYNRYRLKQNKNLQLEEQQKTINIKNSSLIRLVNEKEWLLKEVHHRVKNNLQIVISLLNSQSAYLKEDVAVNAILESRHRIQAMSMLHQRIYQSQNMSGISMPSYIHELVYYLDNSFNLGKRIIFDVNVEDIQLDLVEAVPVGLILNEAITNSLKYAFPNQQEGEIKVSLAKIDDGRLLLSIADDGIGLPQDFDIEEIKSFGLKLIKGLTEDLEGDFTIKSQPGTMLLIEFDHKLVMGSNQEDLQEIAI
ncbi:tetratricopeptide repeat-containing sensor histidine kinase [Dyadobacter pollutisoli]|uniref:histidine kinase n=1 Tax=Dyadobacter pollutisoli TaxID=2910158 RepID=A0A9E8SLQ8_9BACT|nr:sensor histidine kinase [Dyadobacter pollutisoli]WAC12464.1 sensor histidine kinase [Dyadobacter pollutisoli]